MRRLVLVAHEGHSMVVLVLRSAAVPLVAEGHRDHQRRRGEIDHGRCRRLVGFMSEEEPEVRKSQFGKLQAWVSPCP